MEVRKMKETNFTAVEQDDLAALEEMVKENQKEGWVCSPGFHTNIMDGMIQYYQPMVKISSGKKHY
jgi:hypothetical protein